MSVANQPTGAELAAVLEETCRDLPNGGDHESRAYIAGRMIGAVNAGKFSEGELHPTARNALSELVAIQILRRLGRDIPRPQWILSGAQDNLEMPLASTADCRRSDLRRGKGRGLPLGSW